MRKASAETQLRRLKRDYKTLKSWITMTRNQSERAQKEATEWKRRFDVLLERGFRETYQSAAPPGDKKGGE